MPDNEEKLILSTDSSKLVAGVNQAIDKLNKLDNAVGATDKELRQIDNTVDQVAGGLTRLVASTNAAAAGANKAATSYGRFGKQANETLQMLTKLERAQDKYTASQIAAANLPKSLQGRGANGQFTQADATNLTTQELQEIQALYKLQSSTLQSITAEELQRRHEIERSVVAAKELKAAEQGGRGYSNASTISDSNIAQRAKESQDFSNSLRAQMQAQQDATKATVSGDQATERWGHSLSTARYALYDVSATLGVVGLGLLAFGAATYKTSINMERDFQAIVRTTGAVGPQIDYLRDQFVALSQDIPVSFADLTDIGALGGQLGVAGKDLAKFTETVAQFSATTDVTVEASATAFGRLDSLLPDVAGNYEALGSSILKVGVNSVATESGIINTAQQIASMAQIAKISAPDIIGLAGALASLGIPPELSRSVITSTFTKIVSAVNEGGEAAAKFGAVTKMSGEEFQKAWGKDSIGTFQKLLQGINESDNAIGTLDGLGLASQRLTPTLLKLAQNGDLLASTLRDGNSGFQDQGELQRQFNIIAGTTSAKLQVLVQNFQALLFEIGQGGGVFGGLIDGLTDVLKVATDLAGNPVTNFMLQFGVISASLVGVLALVLAGVARTAAGIIALGQAFGVTTIASNGSRLSMSATTAAMLEAGGAARVAAIGVRVLGTALKLLTLVGAAVAIGEIGNALVSSGLEASGAAISVDDLAVSLSKAKDIGKELDSQLGRNGNVFAQFDDLDDKMIKEKLKTISGAANDFEKEWTVGWDNNALRVKQNTDKIDDALTQMVAAGNIEGAQAAVDAFGKQWNLTGAEVSKILDGTTNALKLNEEGLTDDERATQAALIATQAYADGLGVTTEELTALQEALSSGSAKFFDYGTILGSLQEKNQAFAQSQADATASSTDSWESFYNGTSVSIQDFAASLQTSIDEQAVWADNLAILSARGATGFVSELAKMGPQGAELAAQAVNLTTDELNKLEENAQLAAFLASDAFAQAFTERTPNLIAAWKTGGIAAVREAIAAMNAQSKTTPPDPISITADPSSANNTVRTLINSIGKQVAVVQVSGRPINAGQYKDGGLIKSYAQGGQIKGGLPSFATGGYGKFKGPGTGTSDSMLARVSNGEFINTAQTVRHYGADFFDALNRRQIPRFAEGGAVGRQSNVPAQVVASLSPRDRAMMGTKGDIVIMIDGREVARAVNSANSADGLVGAN